MVYLFNTHDNNTIRDFREMFISVPLRCNEETNMIGLIGMILHQAKLQVTTYMYTLHAVCVMIH